MAVAVDQKSMTAEATNPGGLLKIRTKRGLLEVCEEGEGGQEDERHEGVAHD